MTTYHKKKTKQKNNFFSLSHIINGENMKIRLGYVAISQALEETTSTTYPVTRFEKEKNWKKLHLPS